MLATGSDRTLRTRRHQEGSRPEASGPPNRESRTTGQPLDWRRWRAGDGPESALSMIPCAHRWHCAHNAGHLKCPVRLCAALCAPTCARAEFSNLCAACARCPRTQITPCAHDMVPLPSRVLCPRSSSPSKLPIALAGIGAGLARPAGVCLIPVMICALSRRCRVWRMRRACVISGGRREVTGGPS